MLVERERLRLHTALTCTFIYADVDADNDSQQDAILHSLIYADIYADGDTSTFIYADAYQHAFSHPHTFIYADADALAQPFSHANCAPPSPCTTCFSDATHL